MGRIQTYRNRARPSGRASRVPAPYPVSGAVEHRAAAGFGQALQQVSGLTLEQIENRRTNAQFTEGRAAWAAGHDQFLTSLRDDPDYDSYGEKCKKFSADLRKQILSGKLNRSSQESLKRFFVQDSPKQTSTIAGVAWAKEVSYNRASTLRAVRTHEMAGNAGPAISALLRAGKSGYMSAEEVERLSQNVSENADYFRALELIEADPQDFLDIIDDKDEFLSLNPQLRINLKRKARTAMGLELSLQRQAREIDISQEQGRLMGLAREGKLNDEIIRTAKLDEFGTGSKDTFYKMLDAQAKEALEEKKTPYTESDPVVEARILDQIRDTSFKITEKDISELVGKGLSIDDASRMIGMLSTFKDPWFSRVDMYLKSQLGWDGAYEKFLHPQGGIAYKLASDKLFESIETEELRGKDIYERGSAIAIPYIVDYWEKVLMLDKTEVQRMVLMLKGEAKQKKETTAPQKKTKKKTTKQQPFDILDPMGIFK